MREIKFRAFYRQETPKGKEDNRLKLIEYSKEKGIKLYTHPSYLKDDVYKKIYEDYNDYEEKEGEDMLDNSFMEYDIHISKKGKPMCLEGGWDYHGDDESAIIMQYTGLKDNNGKEIYEGDIIDTGDFQGILVIEYELGEFLGCRDGLGVSMSDVARFGEIIGNIYENKSLLTNN